MSKVESKQARPRLHAIDFDVGEPEVIEQDAFEIEDITLTGEHDVVIATELVADVTVSGQHRVVTEDEEPA